VVAAPTIKNSNLEVLSTGYILVGNDPNTTVAHISQTFPIPTKKADIAVCTAMAGELLGMKLIYLDAGSGASEEVPGLMISQVKKSINIPLIVGGGINTKKKVETAYQAGADMIVLGTAIEEKVDFIKSAIAIRDQMNARHS
jgi:putative glycerol-1-phosphate prenyltransferase